MAITLKFYHDSGLTSEVTVANPITASQDVAGTIGPVQKQVWVGSTTASRKFRANSNPGVDQIALSIVDAAAGSGEPATMMKLATTQAGLAGAVAGASLNLGTQILSGVANAISFWLEIDDQTAAVGNYTDVTPQTNILLEESTV